MTRAPRFGLLMGSMAALGLRHVAGKVAHEMPPALKGKRQGTGRSMPFACKTAMATTGCGYCSTVQTPHPYRGSLVMQ